MVEFPWSIKETGEYEPKPPFCPWSPLSCPSLERFPRPLLN